MWIAALAPFLCEERRTVLPSMAITSAAAPVNEATQATKQCWNLTASRLAKMSPNWSCEGVPSRYGRKPPQKIEFLLTKQSNIDEALATGEHGQQTQQQHLAERIEHLAGLPRVRQILEVIQKNNRLTKRSRFPR